MACAAIAGSIRAGCLTESGTYRPRRCTGPVDWAVAQTDSWPGSAATARRAPRPVAPVAVCGVRSLSSGSGAASSVVGLGTGVTTPPPARCRLGGRLGGLAEHEAVGVHAHVRHRPPLAVFA